MYDQERLSAHRNFYAKLITASAGVSEPKLKEAFAATPREKFLGKGPWRVSTACGYIKTPSDDPVFLYQDITVALESEGSINNGQPTLHALCLGAIKIQEGETVLHIGAGSGYYTAILAQLTGPAGRVEAYELESRLAERATANLAEFPNVTVRNVSGSETTLPPCDAIYVNAGATGPCVTWLDALRPKGRLLFPLTPAQGYGAMLLITHAGDGRFDARFLCRARFIPCAGARDEEDAVGLSKAFATTDFSGVRSLQRGTPPDETCWFAGRDGWLSTATAG